MSRKGQNHMDSDVQAAGLGSELLVLVAGVGRYGIAARPIWLRQGNFTGRSNYRYVFHVQL